MTSSGNLEPRYDALQEAVEEVLGLRQEKQHFVELSMMMLHHGRAGSSTLM